jgi:hypothetical protein
MGRRLELLDQTHPVIRWIVRCYEDEPEAFYPAAAIRIPAAEAGVPAGRYVYAVHLRDFTGLRRESRLVFRAASLSRDEILSDEASERLVVTLASRGQEFPNVPNLVHLDAVTAMATRCEERLLADHDRSRAEFMAENDSRCAVQEESARQFHARRVGDLRERIERFRREDRTTMIPATEGLIRRLDDELDLKCRRIQARRAVEEALVPLASGVADVF